MVMLPTGLLDPMGLTPEQQESVRQQALSNAALNFGLQALASSTGVGYKPGFGQILGQAGQAGLQAYQGTFDQQLQNMLRQQQMADLQRKRKAEEDRQANLARLAKSVPPEQQPLVSLFPEQYAESLFREREGTYRPLSSDEVFQMIGYRPQEGEAFQLSPKGSVEPIVRPQRGPLVQNILGGENKYAEAFAKGLAEDDLKLRSLAQSAPSTLQTVQETRNLLEQGKVFTGAFANKRLALAAAGKALGLGGRNTDELIANTERLAANRAKATLDNVKSSGLGAGQGFTDKDREFLERAVQGNIEFTAESLKRQLEIEEKVARATVKKWNSRLKDIPKNVAEMGGLKPVEINVMVDY